MAVDPYPNEGTTVFARPHFRQESDELYFFLSDRVFHHLNGKEARIWGTLRHGPAPLAELADEETVKSMARTGLVDIVAPVQWRGRRRILVVEPHCDDAALSIGGTMWKMRQDVEFHLLTMASRSNYTTAFHLHRNCFNRAQITAMRTAEGELFAAHLGGYYYCADLPEATLRYNDSDWDLGYFHDHEVATAISNNRRAPPAIVEDWVDRLKGFLEGRTFDEIWVPLGAGTHSDHDLARNAALRVVMETKPAPIIRLYEDVPYGAQFQEHTDRILRILEQAGATLVAWSQDVTAEFPAKLSLLTIFASQFKVGSIRDGVERSATGGGTDGMVERLWTLVTLPRDLPEDQIWIGAADIAQMRAELAKFTKGASAERRVAIFAISADGRWSHDLSLLAKAFPAAKFIVYASPRVCAEFRSLKDPRVDLHCVDGTQSAWLKAALREFSTGHRMIIAGDARAKAKALAMLWPTGQKIICSAADHAMQALEASLQSSP